MFLSVWFCQLRSTARAHGLIWMAVFSYHLVVCSTECRLQPCWWKIRCFPRNTVDDFFLLFFSKPPLHLGTNCSVLPRASLPSSVQYSGGRPMAQRRRSPLQQRPNSSLNRGSYKETFRSSWRAAPTRSYWEPSSIRYSQRSFRSSGRFVHIPV